MLDLPSVIPIGPRDRGKDCSRAHSTLNGFGRVHDHVSKVEAAPNRFAAMAEAGSGRSWRAHPLMSELALTSKASVHHKSQ
jgi:hypothetical protein